MRVVKPSTLRTYSFTHRDAESSLTRWLVTAEAAEWQSIQDVRRAYRDADATQAASGSTVTIFNVKGNRYRLVVAIHYNAQRIYIRDFLTHEEYNNQLWKRRH